MAQIAVSPRADVNGSAVGAACTCCSLEIEEPSFQSHYCPCADADVGVEGLRLRRQMNGFPVSVPHVTKQKGSAASDKHPSNANGQTHRFALFFPSASCATAHLTAGGTSPSERAQKHEKSVAHTA